MNEVIEHKYQQQTNKKKDGKKHLTFKADDTYLFSTKKNQTHTHTHILLECKCQLAANINKNTQKKITFSIDHKINTPNSTKSIECLTNTTLWTKSIHVCKIHGIFIGGIQSIVGYSEWNRWNKKSG